MAGALLRVTSLNPVRDAERVGHVVGPARLVSDARGEALHHRFMRLAADGASAAVAAFDPAGRAEALRAELNWATRSIVEDLAALEAGANAGGRTAELLNAARAEIAAIAELSTGQPFAPAVWRGALDAFGVHVEVLIAREAPDALDLADIDLALERLERIEDMAAAALREYLRPQTPAF